MKKPKLKAGYGFHALTDESDFVNVPNDEWETVVVSARDAGAYVGRVNIDGAPCLVWEAKKGGFLAQTCASHGLEGMPGDPNWQKSSSRGRGASHEDELTAERIKLDRQGYDEQGRYYGVGDPLWSVDHAESGKTQAVRAKTKAAALAAARKLRW